MASPDEETKHSVKVVAMRLAAETVAALAESDYLVERWEDFPELGEHDWERVVTMTRQELRRTVGVLHPGPASYDMAYKRLTQRAEQ